MALVLFVDTYLTVEEADSMLSGSTDWDSATLSAKEFNLKEATRSLDTETWLSAAVLEDQLLSWPRATFNYYDPSRGRLIVVQQGTVPLRLKQAVANLALHFTKYPSASSGYEATWDSITVGPISLSNSNSSSDPGVIPRVAVAIVDLLAPLLSNQLGLGSSKLWWRAN